MRSSVFIDFYKEQSETKSIISFSSKNTLNSALPILRNKNLKKKTLADSIKRQSRSHMYSNTRDKPIFQSLRHNVFRKDRKNIDVSSNKRKIISEEEFRRLKRLNPNIFIKNKKKKKEKTDKFAGYKKFMLPEQKLDKQNDFIEKRKRELDEMNDDMIRKEFSIFLDEINQLDRNRCESKLNSITFE